MSEALKQIKSLVIDGSYSVTIPIYAFQKICMDYEQLKAENLDLKKTLNSVKNCQVGDFVVYHPIKDPDADNVFDTIQQLKSKLKIAVEALQKIGNGTGQSSWTDRIISETAIREIGDL